MTSQFWVVTFNAKDFPGKYVIRRHEWRASGGGEVKGGPTGEYYVADSLEEARSHVPYGGQRQARDPWDDPVIVEWYI